MNQDTKLRMHVALSPWDLTDDYNRHAGVTMLSVLEHCSQPVTFHLLYDASLSIGKEEKETYNKSCYQRIADKYDCELKYHHVSVPNWIDERTIPAIEVFSLGTLLRLFISDVIVGIDKLLYLDCDIVVNTDLDILWDIDINKIPLAACLDEGMWREGYKYKDENVSINLNQYFNAGVILMNLEELRLHHNLSQEGVQFLQNHPNTPFLDQDVLNSMFQDKCLFLERKYNIFSTSIDAVKHMSDCIIHYAGPTVKPWKRYNGKIDEIYWHYLSLTPWAENGKITEYLSPILKNSDDIIQELPDTIWEFPFYNKIKTLWKLTLPLWIKLIIRYMKS